MRLFFAAAIPEDVRAELRGRLDREVGIHGLVLGRPESLHITLRFIGETAMERFASVEQAGADAARRRGFSVAVEGAGVFPDDRAPTVFWAGVGGEVAEMTATAHALERALVKAGFSPDDRRFSPHVTLGRSRRGARLDAAGAAAFRNSLAGYVSRSFDVKEIALFRSQPGPVGPRYDIIRTFPLS